MIYLTISYCKYPISCKDKIMALVSIKCSRLDIFGSEGIILIEGKLTEKMKKVKK